MFHLFLAYRFLTIESKCKSTNIILTDKIINGNNSLHCFISKVLVHQGREAYLITGVTAINGDSRLKKKVFASAVNNVRKNVNIISTTADIIFRERELKCQPKSVKDSRGVTALQRYSSF